MLEVNAPLLQLLHEQVILQHWGREGVTRASALADLVRREPKLSRPTRRGACEQAAHYLVGIVRDKPFRDQNDTLAWLTAMYVLGRWGYACTPRTILEPVDLVCQVGESPDAWPVEKVAGWLEQRTLLAPQEAQA